MSYRSPHLPLSLPEMCGKTSDGELINLMHHHQMHIKWLNEIGQNEHQQKQHQKLIRIFPSPPPQFTN